MFTTGQRVRLQKGVIKQRGRPSIGIVDRVDGDKVILVDSIYGKKKWPVSKMQAADGNSSNALSDVSETTQKKARKKKAASVRQNSGRKELTEAVKELDVFSDHTLYDKIQERVSQAMDSDENYTVRNDAISYLMAMGREYLRVKPNDKLSKALMDVAVALRTVM